MKAFEVFRGDVIYGIKVHWAEVGRPYVLVGHPASERAFRLPLSNALIESIGCERVDRIAECDISFDGKDGLELGPATMPCEKSVLAVVTYYAPGFPSYIFKLGGTAGSKIVKDAELRWPICDGLYMRGLSALVRLNEGDSLEIVQDLMNYTGTDVPWWKGFVGYGHENYEHTPRGVGSLTVGRAGQQLVYTKAHDKPVPASA